MSCDSMRPVEKDMQDYYDADDTFNFYREVWGGINIHVGLFENSNSPPTTSSIREASERCSLKLLSKFPAEKVSNVMDLGSGYGETARLIARKFGASVQCIDVSAKSNELNRRITKMQGLSDLVHTVGERSFISTGEPSDSFDVVVSQDALGHAGKYREDTIREACRVLKHGGYLIFTDIMVKDNIEQDAFEEILKRIKGDELASPERYFKIAEHVGFEVIEFDEHCKDMTRFYSSLLDVGLSKRKDFLMEGIISEEGLLVIENGLRSWIKHATVGNILWGFMVFRKK